MNAQGQDWDEMRVFLAVTTIGSLSGVGVPASRRGKTRRLRARAHPIVVDPQPAFLHPGRKEKRRLSSSYIVSRCRTRARRLTAAVASFWARSRAACESRCSPASM